MEDADGVLSTVPVACGACGAEYERPDMAGCDFHGGAVCSLCCSLESACHDVCKKPGPVDLPIPSAGPV